MTPLIDLISSTWSSKRGEYQLVGLGGNLYEVSKRAEGIVVFEGTRDACTAWIDRQCAEAVAGVMVPAEPWRIGSHYGIHVYAGDRPVATFHYNEEAAIAVAAVNGLIPATTSETQP